MQLQLVCLLLRVCVKCKCTICMHMYYVLLIVRLLNTADVYFCSILFLVIFVYCYCKHCCMVNDNMRKNDRFSAVSHTATFSRRTRGERREHAIHETPLRNWIYEMLLLAHSRCRCHANLVSLCVRQIMVNNNNTVCR